MSIEIPRIEITLWTRLANPVGRRVAITWPKLFSQFVDATKFEGKEQHPGWSPVTFRGNHRELERVEVAYALGLDVDGTWSLEGATEALRSFAGFIHTTKSHTTEVHRFRIILPLSRGVSADEYDRLWRSFDRLWPGKFDPTTKDASRFWYTPGVGEGGIYETRDLRGRAVDVDVVLAGEPEEQRPESPAFEPSGAPALRRARAYVATMPGAISGDHGHRATFRVAVIAAKGFNLGESDTLAVLHEYNQRCEPPWSTAELERKASQAVHRGRLPEGFLLGESWDNTRPAPRDDSAAPDHWARQPGEDDDTPSPPWRRFGVATMVEVLQGVYEACQRKVPATSVSTGHAEVDKIIGGYRPGMITVLGAETNWGKSSWALMALDDGLRAGKRVLYVSGEDGRTVMGKRIMARRSKVSALALRDEVLEDAELTACFEVLARAEDEPWFLDGIGKPAEVVADTVSSLLAVYPYDLVVFDYLQAWRTKTRAQDRRNEVTLVARLFADAVKSCSSASGLFISQIKRLEGTGREPDKHDLKESGDVENAAEHVLLGWFKQGEGRVVKVDKNKDGPQVTGALRAPFDDATASFIRTAPWRQ